MTRACFLFALMAVVLPATAPVSAIDNLPLNPSIERTVNEVAPGLTHIHLSADSTSDGLPQNVHVLQADLSSYRIEMVMAKDQLIGQETTSNITRRYGATAGVNAGYSFSNDPWNPYHGDTSEFFVLNGRILSEPIFAGRRSVGICTRNGKQSMVVTQPDLTVRVTLGDGPTSEVTGLNRKRGGVRGERMPWLDGDTAERDRNDLIVYMPEWNRSTLTDQDGVEVIVREDTVATVHVGAGSHLIPPDGYVLSGLGSYADWLKENAHVGQSVEITYKLISLEAPDQAVRLDNCSYTTAGTVLLVDGKRYTDYASEGFEPWFYDKRHPRTAIGTSRDGETLWLVVADGRQPDFAMGMTLPELTDLFEGLGAYNAYNLDGGGSSTMVLQDEVVNRYSDRHPRGGRRERRRCDAILLFPR